MHHGPNIIMLLAFCLAVFVLDLYAYQSLRALTNSTALRVAYWAIMLLLLVLPVVGMSFMTHASSTGASQLGFVSVSLFMTAVAMVVAAILPLLLEDIVRLVALPVRYFMQNSPAFLPRIKWVSTTSLALGGLMLMLMIYGMLYGKYDYKVHKQTIYFSNLPQNFDGLRILQLSDFHSGSTHNFKAVQRGIDLVKQQNADLFIFSGDMVNNVADEFTPWVSYMAQIKVPYGQFAVLGNHDYGDYHSWSSKEEKLANLQSLIAKETEAGLRVLLDENVAIEKDGQKIVLVGVQNIGMGTHFSAYGDLQKALVGADSAAFKILVSHDPSHWDKQVSTYPEDIQLTLAGHTHGFQFGVENRLFKWSPVQWMYPHWAGLYEKNGRCLYVNRGFGFIPFFLGRVGIMPEITVIELRKK